MNRPQIFHKGRLGYHLTIIVTQMLNNNCLTLSKIYGIQITPMQVTSFDQ